MSLLRTTPSPRYPALARTGPRATSALLLAAGWLLSMLPVGALPEEPEPVPETGSRAPTTRSRPAWTHEVGVEVPLEGLSGLSSRLRDAGAAGRGVMLLTDLDLEDAFAQDPSLSSLEEVLAPLRESSVRTVLSLHFSGRELPGPSEPDRMASWELALGAVARLGADLVNAVILSLPDGPEEGGRRVEEVAYLVKRTSVAVRTVRRDLAVLVDLPENLDEWLEPLVGEVGPHVDGVSLSAPEGADAAWVERQAGALFRRRPGLRLLTRGWGADPPERIMETYLRAVGAGAGAVLFELPAPESEPHVLTLLGRIRGQIPDRFSPADPAPLKFVNAEGREVQVRHGRFFDPRRLDAIVWYQAEPGFTPGTVGVTFLSADAISPSVFDIVSNERRRLAVWAPDPKARLTRFNLTPRDVPTLLRYHHEFGQAGGRRDDLKVDTERIPPVEEILARHQEFQTAQDRRIQRWIADATIALHYRIGTATANFDLTYHSVLYADPAGTTEWEHRRLDFNGAPYRSEKLPDLPYVLPERVVQVPLRLTLDKDYLYRLEGSAEVEGAPCWVVEFEPVDPARNLYRGKVWIDKEIHARRRLIARQTRVETPLLSVEDDLRFEPLGSGEEPLWVLRRSRGQQLITVSGHNLVLVREIEFGNIQINPADFEERRAAALASPSFIVRETGAQYETLERRADGTRVARPSGIQKTWLLLGGVFYNESVDAPVPLAGVNYFNFKTGGRDLHLEVFAAGAFNFVNLTDPGWLGSKWEVGADLTTRAFPLSDRFVDSGSEGEEVEEFGVDEITQFATLNAAHQLGSFFKFTGFYELQYARYSRGEDARGAFVTPSDTFVHSAEARLELDRKGTSVRLFGRVSRRSDWDRWGFPRAALGSTFGPVAPAFGEGTLLEEFDPDSREFTQYGVTVARLWTPSVFQTLRGDLTWLQGEDLDRFSKFRFSTIGNLRLRGYGGSGVRFDQGGIARATYTFKVGPFLRLDAALEHGRVRERGIGEGGFVSFTGLGLAGNFTLPRGWVARLDYGIGLASDLEEQDGEQEIVLVLLKIL